MFHRFKPHKNNLFDPCDEIICVDVNVEGRSVKIIASVEDHEVIEKILKHLGLDEAS